MKNILLFSFFVLNILVFGQDKKTIKNFVESFVIYRTVGKTFYRNKGDVLVTGIYPAQNYKNKNVLSIHFDSSGLLKDFSYKNVYQIRDFKLIVLENEFSKKFENIFKELPYENFNLGTGDVNYDYRSWSFIFNKKNEIIAIYGFLTNDEYHFLLKRKFKFSKDFDMVNIIKENKK